MKTINDFKSNAEEDYITTPISVLRYISELEKRNVILLKALQKITREGLKKLESGNIDNFTGAVVETAQKVLKDER